MRSLLVLLALAANVASSQDIYKWKDENGKVHYGAQSAAPDHSKKLDIKNARPAESPPVNARPALVIINENRPKAQTDAELARLIPALSAPQRRAYLATQSVSADPASVGPRCKGLMEEIMKVKSGPWRTQSDNFNNACPGIAYECTEFTRSPEHNHCGWIVRKDNKVINTVTYN